MHYAWLNGKSDKPHSGLKYEKQVQFNGEIFSKNSSNHIFDKTSLNSRDILITVVAELEPAVTTLFFRFPFGG